MDPLHSRWDRERVALRYGTDMTVAIAAFAGASEIVTISDARLSYGEIIPAADDGTMKNTKISRRWSMMFAAQDATAFTPVVRATMDILDQLEPNPNSLLFAERDFTLKSVMDAARMAYEKEFNERFFREKLARFGFADIGEFRRLGLAEMGKDLYHQYAMDLAKFDLGLELLVYGFTPAGTHSIFEVANPGKIINHSLRNYAAIGSGSLMALAALNKKPLAGNILDTAYRIIDAKFSAETARDVGKKTHVISLNDEGKNGFLYSEHLEAIHRIWEEELARPHPEGALEVLRNSSLIKAILKEDSLSERSAS